MSSWTYTIVLFLSLIGPLAFSFEPRLRFASRWRTFLPAILIPGTYFLRWDQLFAKAQVWGFTPKYVLGIYLGDLPLEEVLFFFVVPYACLFVYENVRQFKPSGGRGLRVAMLAGASVLFGVAYLAWPRLYTSLACLPAAAFLILLGISLPPRLPTYLLAYAISLAPFLLVNGVLTGALTAEPIVWYNSREVINWRLGTIPLEDFVYMFVLLISNFLIYEFQRDRRTTTHRDPHDESGVRNHTQH